SSAAGAGSALERSASRARRSRAVRRRGRSLECPAMRPAAVSFAIVAAVLAAVPHVAAARPGSELKLQDGHARFPFELRGQHIWVRGQVNADSAWIVIDTGASQTVMDLGLARQ